ncbi:MFS transporter [Nocardia stercoris]|uniref:DHA2 family efflux MFS transporter permease subunit n=1 Tax=Nocardia stercoris TaxID=2483361 RepID=A0A3M2LDV1_9NOCA|nr:MFS transporter [Nocardia stercoris]RMI35642.1 DHA2 family efflux MFS transporter permease subunit [Nocardia stercoris]
MTTERNPWWALGALCVGYFMILLDMTIVAVANPAIMTGLHTDMSKVIWVTSAYLLTFAVPLLITGRLGDRFGQKYLYLGGLAVFTLASLWCGLAGDIGTLIAARAVQGLGAALMAPQTMAVIGRIFPWDKRGAAMGVWGGIAGIATLIGPIFGGALIDNGGWQWIFYVNVPIGLIALALGAWLVPLLPTNEHRFDVPGVIVVAIGMSALVFGIQEGNVYHWAAWVWALIIGGLVVLGLYLAYQRNHAEPLVPLGLFRNRNFSLGNVATGALGAAMTAQMVPSYFYLQAVRDLSPTRAALVFAPMAVVSAILSPVVGKLSDKVAPRYLLTFGFGVFTLAVLWFVFLATPDGSIPLMLVMSVVCGIGSSCIWAPLPATALRSLPLAQMGAASGIYNTTRQVGSVLGSAGIGALLTARISAHGLPASVGETGRLADAVKAPYASALTDSLYLTVILLVVCVVTAIFFTLPAPAAAAPAPAPAPVVDEQPRADLADQH